MNIGGEGFGQLQGLADEDFKEAGSSSAPTKDSDPDWDSDALLDDPNDEDEVG